MRLPFIDDFGNKYNITLKISSYEEGGSLDIAMLYYDIDFKTDMPYGVLTVNLCQELEPDCAFVDTNNCGENIMRFIEDNKIGVPTGKTARSGFCTYPEVKFNLERIREIENESYSK